MCPVKSPLSGAKSGYVLVVKDVFLVLVAPGRKWFCCLEQHLDKLFSFIAAGNTTVKNV